MQDLKQKPVASSTNNAADFGFNPRPRRRAKVIPPDTRSNEELVAEYLAQNKKITRCETRYADGAVKQSGQYDF